MSKVTCDMAMSVEGFVAHQLRAAGTGSRTADG